jgi:hypothetical protein
LLRYEFSKLNDGLVQNLNKLSVATPWLRRRDGGGVEAAAHGGAAGGGGAAKGKRRATAH